MNTRPFAAAVAAGVLLAGASSAAHHSLTATYRQHERITIEGVVVSLVFRNPHSYVHVEAPDAHRRVRVWAVESGMGHQLRDALSRGPLQPGDRVIVTGEPGRDDGAWRMRLRTLVRPSDGWRWIEDAALRGAGRWGPASVETTPGQGPGRER